ncbi:MAG: o-succinylbenzoate--CoA ligase, partial [Dehalococcoidia bacterium]|nr:o-succinylbenzoate--CoA ligase [Dehalococcoidia bacterium]
MAKPVRITVAMVRENKDKGIWSDATISDFWDKNAELYPDKEAVVDSKTRLTWAEARVWIDRLALGLLELGF